MSDNDPIPGGNAVLHSENIPADLRALPQWVAWRYEERDGKRTKAPIDAKSNGSLRYAKSNDPSTWASFDDALAACERHSELAGVGFCFSPDDGLTGLDLDHVIDSDTGELKPEAAEILQRFAGTYCEVSPSGTGLRLFCRGKPKRSGKNTGKTKWLEVYSHPSSRYLTVTGNAWNGNAAEVTDQQAALDWLHGRFMESTESKPVDSKPGPGSALNLDDAALLSKARAAKNGADFDRLWSGDTSGHGGDDSSADLALCNHLAFWTDGDADRIDRLFRQSGLMRPKWNHQHGERTYGAATVAKAIDGMREGFGGRKAPPASQSPPPLDDGYLDALGTAEPPKAAKLAIPPLTPFSDGELAGAKLHPRCIVEKYLYADLALVAAAGGTGKTTALIHEAVCIATGRDLWGCRVWEPGATLFITAEDSRELFAARLREVMDAMELSDYERRLARERVTAWDVSGDMIRLAELDSGGNIRLTELADSIVAAYRDCGLVQIVFDPAISFGPGERLVNDGEQAVVTACRRIVRGLNCCVRLIHHTGKANARNGAIDQYAARGGTALPDGCRMVTILSAVSGDTEGQHLNRPEGFDLQPGESGFIMARAKLSYAPPQPNIWIRRRGFAFEYFTEQPRNSEAVRDRDAEKVAAFLMDEMHHGRRYTANSLELSGKADIPRSRLRAALATLETVGRIEERDLPAEQRRGKRKTYLHPLQSADSRGGLAAERAVFATTEPAIPPVAINPPPYREYKSGGLAAAFNSPDSSNPPADSGGLTADWRINETEGHHPPCGLTEPQLSDVARDAETLAGVLKFYRGWVPPKELSPKVGYWPESRVIGAAEYLVKSRRALKEGGMYKQVTP